MKAKEVMTIGRSRSSAGVERRLAGGRPASLAELGELDDQDRVLARETDEHDETDLREDVDVEPRPPDAGDRAAGRTSAPTRIDRQRERPASYRAASTRNTNTTERTKMIRPVSEVVRSRYVSSVHS